MNTNITFTSNLELLGYLLTNPDKAIVLKNEVLEDLFIVTNNKLWCAERMITDHSIMSGWQSLNFSYFEQWEFPQEKRVIPIKIKLTK